MTTEKKDEGTGLGGPASLPSLRLGGLGAIPCPKGYTDAQACAVYELLQAGSPRLAYAMSRGVPLFPYVIIINALFADTSETDITNAGNLPKIVQDTIIDDVDFQVQNQNTPQGFDALTNYFFQLESGIKADVKIIGAGGGYNMIPDFTPLALIKRAIKQPGWLLTWNNGIVMDFHASIPLPFPVEITFAFKGRTSYWPRLIDISNDEALRKLKESGFVCDMYEPLYCT
jgi:hypothetical protein